MTRRAMLMAFAPRESVAPTDQDRMNSFAAAWNVYVERLREGVIDIKLWARAKRAWERIS